MQPLMTIAMSIMEHLNERHEKARDQKRWNKLFKTLNDLRDEFKKGMGEIRRALKNARLREITASIMDHEEAFRELLAIRMESFIINLIEKTRKSKNEIEQELKSQELTNEDVIRYYTLYYTVVPLRAACFEMMDNDQTDVGELVVSELRDLTETKDRVKSTIAAWSEQRVSPIERHVEVEPMPGEGSMVTTTLTYKIDGKPGGIVVFDGSDSGDNYDKISKDRQDAMDDLTRREWEPFDSILQDADRAIARWNR